MYITKNVQNAIILLNELKTATEPVNVQKIAEKHDLSELFLQQIGRKLRVAGWIKTVRGPGGGYLLVKKNMTMLEVHELFASRSKKRVISIPSIEGKLRGALSAIAVLN